MTKHRKPVDFESREAQETHITGRLRELRETYAALASPGWKKIEEYLAYTEDLLVERLKTEENDKTIFRLQGQIKFSSDFRNLAKRVSDEICDYENRLEGLGRNKGD